jgi:hypothetical protein
MVTKRPTRVLFRVLCLIGALAHTAACMSTPQGPVTAKRIQPKIFAKGWDCDREPIAGHGTALVRGSQGGRQKEGHMNAETADLLLDVVARRSCSRSPALP